MATPRMQQQVNAPIVIWVVLDSPNGSVACKMSSSTHISGLTELAWYSAFSYRRIAICLADDVVLSDRASFTLEQDFL